MACRFVVGEAPEASISPDVLRNQPQCHTDLKHFCKLKVLLGCVIFIDFIVKAVVPSEALRLPMTVVPAVEPRFGDLSSLGYETTQVASFMC